MIDADAKTPPAWFLYLIETATGTLYTGVTTDVDRRFSEHSQSGKKAARFLRGKGPLNLRFSAEVGDRSSALRMEAAVKKLSRDDKLKLIESGQFPVLG